MIRRIDSAVGRDESTRERAENLREGNGDDGRGRDDAKGISAPTDLVCDGSEHVGCCKTVTRCCGGADAVDETSCSRFWYGWNELCDVPCARFFADMLVACNFSECAGVSHSCASCWGLSAFDNVAAIPEGEACSTCSSGCDELRVDRTFADMLSEDNEVDDAPPKRS